MVWRSCSNSVRESAMASILLKDSATDPYVSVRTDYKTQKKKPHTYSLLCRAPAPERMLDRRQRRAHTSAKSPAPLVFCRIYPETYRLRVICGCAPIQAVSLRENTRN